jgi:hypothetical protein
MSSRKVTVVANVCLLGLVAALLSGCFLRSMFGRVVIVSDIANEVNEIIAAVFGGATVAVCYAPDGYLAQCMYIVDGEIITSTFYLVSELGLAGVLIDPLILQVPAGAITVTATYTQGNSAQPALISLQPRFEMLPNQFITAETGTQFLIMEFPTSTLATLTATNPFSGTPFNFALTFTQTKPISQPVEPAQIKMMLTAKVTTRGRVYYAPILPCVTSFANVPTLTIPITTTFTNLQVQLGDVIRQGQAMPCNQKFYDYSNAPPPSYPVYLPLVAR